MLTTDYCRQLFEHMLSIKVSVVTDLGALQACLVVVKITAIVNEKKRSEETQTLSAGCM